MSTDPTLPVRSDDAGAPRRVRVALVFGGRSSEHAVSCATASSVLEALDRDRYDVVPVGIAKDGHWVLAPDDPQSLRLAAGHTPEVASGAPSVIVPTSATDRTFVVRIRAGKAVSLSDAPAGLKRTERLEWFESEAMNRVYAMRDELCAEHPGRF